ncbi:MAG: hypothetical protein IT226_09025 [Flavobacteriales bacterium]|nr:hypothetical protein [Flavobacteriales bacterium]
MDPLDLPLHGYYGNYNNHPDLSAALGNALRSGSSVVLFGSSELTSKDDPAKPVGFLAQELKVPMIAIGHAGNQSFSIHAQLISANASLEHARLVILLSPGWFAGSSATDGTSLEAFLEYQPSPSLAGVAERLRSGDTTAVPIAHYLIQHRSELSGAQPVVKWIARNTDPVDRIRYAFSQPWAWYGVKAITDMTPVSTTTADAAAVTIPAIEAAEWARLMGEGTARHLVLCTNNHAFVNDEYYSTYVNGATREVEAVPVDHSKELRDLQTLLHFLKQTKADPLFVIQPLNPFVYTNLHTLDPTIGAVRAALDHNGFDYLDMWRSDTTGYRPGTLTDIMHLGPVGWYRVDSAVVAHFQ